MVFFFCFLVFIIMMYHLEHTPKSYELIFFCACRFKLISENRNRGKSTRSDDKKIQPRLQPRIESDPHLVNRNGGKRKEIGMVIASNTRTPSINRFKNHEDMERARLILKIRQYSSVNLLHRVRKSGKIHKLNARRPNGIGQKEPDFRNSSKARMVHPQELRPKTIKTDEHSQNSNEIGMVIASDVRPSSFNQNREKNDENRLPFAALVQPHLLFQALNDPHRKDTQGGSTTAVWSEEEDGDESSGSILVSLKPKTIRFGHVETYRKPKMTVVISSKFPFFRRTLKQVST
jgi:hypothetical protein